MYAPEDGVLRFCGFCYETRKARRRHCLDEDHTHAVQTRLVGLAAARFLVSSRLASKFHSVATIARRQCPVFAK